MKKIVVCEVVYRYHEVEIDEELDEDEIVDEARERVDRFNESGAEALDIVLGYQYKHNGFDYKLKNSYCGEKTENLLVVEND